MVCCLSVSCLQWGFAGSVKFHFVIIPLFFHSNVSTCCFSKSSLLLSCKDLLFPWCCTPPAVPQTEQFHHFFEPSKRRVLAPWIPQPFLGDVSEKERETLSSKTVQATISRLLLQAWSFSIHWWPVPFPLPWLCYSLFSLTIMFKDGPSEAEHSLLCSPPPQKGWDYPLVVQGRMSWSHPILMASVMQNELQRLSRAAPDLWGQPVHVMGSPHFHHQWLQWVAVGFLSMLCHPPSQATPPESHIDLPLAFRVLRATGNTALLACPIPGMLVSLALLPFLILVALGHQILCPKFWDTFCPRSVHQPDTFCPRSVQHQTNTKHLQEKDFWSNCVLTYLVSLYFTREIFFPLWWHRM